MPAQNILPESDSPADDLLWGCRAASEWLGCPLSTLYSALASGKLDAAYEALGHKTRVFSKSRLRDLMPGAQGPHRGADRG
jgi:hypothetical protein